MKNEDILKIENIKNNKETYIIRWQMTSLCNYKCDFCVQGNQAKHIADSKGESSEVRAKICNKIIKFIEDELDNKYKKVNIFLIGGEITILKDYIEIISKLVNVKFKGIICIHITSNLSCNEDLLTKTKNMFKNKTNRSLDFSASYYKDFTTEDEFIKKVKCFEINNSAFSKVINHIFPKKRNNHIYLNVGYPLISDIDYDKYIKFKQKYSKYCSFMSYIVIRNYKEGISEELKKKLGNQNKKNIKVTFKNGITRYYSRITKLGFDLDDVNIFNPKGFLCDSGVHNISIDNIGNISRCQGCPQQTKLGNIEQNDLKLLYEKAECPITACNCDYFREIEQK